MRKSLGFLLLFTLFMQFVVASAFADNEFHLIYELKQTAADESFVSGTLNLYMVNNSGAVVKDVVAWIPEPNKVTYNNRAIFFPDIEAGQAIGVLNQWTVPLVETTIDVPDRPVVWRVEFTDSYGQRVGVDVVGERVLAPVSQP